MKAPSGHYRKLLTNPHIRIAFTHTPIYGCTRISPNPIIEELEKSDDEYAQYYIDGLKSGEMVTIVENNHLSDQNYAPGELYFKS